MIGYKKHSLIEILTDSGPLSVIVNKVEQLAKLNRIVHQKLDPELAKYCRVANLRDGTLILTTTSPATGHLLRFAKTELLSTLRADPEWCHLKSIKLHVRPEVVFGPSPPHPTKTLPKPILSTSSREALKSIAHLITSPLLQEALLRLSCHSRESGNPEK